MLKVGIIGCGNAGNQICALTANKYPDIPTIAINCSENDMKLLPKNVIKCLIGDGKGAGKNREEAQGFLKEAIMDFVNDEEISTILDDLELIFIVSSAGGGTGSGTSILLSNIISELYSNSGPVPIVVGILPTIPEALSTQANALEYLTELYNVSDMNLTYMLYDNEKLSKLPSVEILKGVNERVVEDINVLRLFYNKTTTYNSIDERDAFTLFTTPGRLFVASLFDLKEKDVDDESTIEDKLIFDIKKNPHSELQNDGIVNRTGIIINLSESLMSQFDTNIPKIQKLIGVPIEAFEHIAVSKDRKDINNVFFIASGLTPVNDRIAKIKDRIDEINEAQKKQADESELDSEMLAGIQSKRVYRNTSNKKGDIDLQAIFDKFKK